MTTRPRFSLEQNTRTLGLISSPHLISASIIPLSAKTSSQTLSNDIIPSSSPFTAICVFQEGQSQNVICALTNLDKALYLYDFTNRTLINELKTKKRIMDILHVPHMQKLYFADKFGDVWSLEEAKMREKQPEEVTKPKKQEKGKPTKDVAHTDDNDNMTLQLGHLATLTQMILSKDQKYLITADRDEKIRVSHFPETHEIWSFCLGHRQTVTAVSEATVPGTNVTALVSGSLDKTLRVWEYTNENKPLRFTHQLEGDNAFPALIRTLGNIAAVSTEKAKEITFYAVQSNFELTPVQTLTLNSEVLHFEFVDKCPNGERLMVLVADSPNMRIYRVTKRDDSSIEFEQEETLESLRSVQFDFKPDAETYLSSMKKHDGTELQGRHKRSKSGEDKKDNAKEEQ